MKRKILSIALALLITCAAVMPASAASTDVSVSYGVCVQPFETDSIFGEMRAHKLIMPRGHGNMHITLGSVYSTATYADLTETAPDGNASLLHLLAIILGLKPRFADNVYSIRFYDYSGNMVYFGTIPNGGSVDLYVGENVDYINVWSWYDVPSGALPTPMTRGQVYYSNAYEY